MSMTPIQLNHRTGSRTCGLYPINHAHMARLTPSLKLNHIINYIKSACKKNAKPTNTKAKINIKQRYDKPFPTHDTQSQQSNKNNANNTNMQRKLQCSSQTRWAVAFGATEKGRSSRSHSALRAKIRKTAFIERTELNWNCTINTISKQR